jgi:mannose-6-phosphate isomerase-like protein (cupin superfamily)
MDERGARCRAVGSWRSVPRRRVFTLLGAGGLVGVAARRWLGDTMAGTAVPAVADAVRPIRTQGGIGIGPEGSDVAGPRHTAPGIESTPGSAATGRDGMPGSVRRVVTGTNERGRSTVADDGPAPRSVTLEHGGGFTETVMWEVGVPLGDPSQGGDPPAGPLPVPPPPGTVAFFQTIVPPDAALAEVDRDAMLLEIEEKWPSLLKVVDPARGPGMHRTDTLDLLTVVSGEVWLVLEESEVHLKMGDCVVQRGTWHAWRNRSSAPCLLAGVMIGSGEQAPG